MAEIYDAYEEYANGNLSYEEYEDRVTEILTEVGVRL